VSPYDNPLLWTGHSTKVDLSCQSIGAILVSVGGGGLICGVLEVLEHHGQKLKVVACETKGAARFGSSWLKSPPSGVQLETISFIATSLGALEVTAVAISRSQRHEENGGKVEAAICTDKEAIEACLQFLSDHRILVEPACGAGLAALYSDHLRKQTLEGAKGPIVVEVCGGSGISLELLSRWKNDFGIK
jgi:L-serine/L-threonine ammonia-lyase